MGETLQEPKNLPNHSFFNKEITKTNTGFKIPNNIKLEILILTPNLLSSK
jgi:hypothetical protein